MADAVQTAESYYSKATTAEHARDFDAAFKAYISAAQAFLRRARNAPSGQNQESARAKAMVETCLARAEFIKAARKDALKPVTPNPFSPGKLLAS